MVNSKTFNTRKISSWFKATIIFLFLPLLTACSSNASFDDKALIDSLKSKVPSITEVETHKAEGNPWTEALVIDIFIPSDYLSESEVQDIISEIEQTNFKGFSTIYIAFSDSTGNSIDADIIQENSGIADFLFTNEGFDFNVEDDGKVIIYRR